MEMRSHAICPLANLAHRLLSKNRCYCYNLTLVSSDIFFSCCCLLSLLQYIVEFHYLWRVTWQVFFFFFDKMRYYLEHSITIWKPYPVNNVLQQLKPIYTGFKWTFQKKITLIIPRPFVLLHKSMSEIGLGIRLCCWCAIVSSIINY